MSTILPWFEAGGPFILPIVLAAAIGLGLVVERLWYLSKRSRVHAVPFTDEIVSLARSGSTEEALRLCADHQAALADLGIVVLRTPTRDRATLVEAAQGVTCAILPPQRRSVIWLRALTAVVLMLGAIGAIANLHSSVEDGASVLAVAAFALRPVGAALLVALPLVLGTALVSASTSRLAAQLQELSARLVAALTGGPDVRLGHRA